jgi:hypothetical protein
MKKQPLLIGLFGRKRSGKDTVLSILKQIGVPAERVSFADPLKMEVAVACNVTPSYLEIHKEIFRPCVAWWGTEFRRGLYDDNYWVTRAAERIDQLAHEGASVICLTDVRFPNEARFVRQRGGLLWKIERPIPFRQRIREALFGYEHASESHFSTMEPDHVIVNDGSLEQLRERVLWAARLYKLLPNLNQDEEVII